MNDYLASSIDIGDCIVAPNTHLDYSGIDRFLRKGMTILVTPSKVIVGPLDCDPLPDRSSQIYRRLVRTVGQVPTWIIEQDDDDDDEWLRPRVFDCGEVITLCRRARLLGVMRHKACTLKVIPNRGAQVTSSRMRGHRCY